MLPTRAVMEHMKFLNQELTDIVLELRNLIALEKPDATEEFQRGGLTYYDARRGGHVSAGICMIHILKNEIHLAFVHGIFLPDPKHLLIGEGHRKAKRFLRLKNYQDAPWEEIRKLIHESVKIDVHNLST